MRRATATSRCEVGGVTYNPGDSMMVTDEQLAFLKSHNAATEVVMYGAPPLLPRAGDTMEQVEEKYRRVIRPKPTRKSEE